MHRLYLVVLSSFKPSTIFLHIDRNEKQPTPSVTVGALNDTLNEVTCPSVTSTIRFD